MIIVLKPHTTKDDVSRVENMVKKRGLDTHIVQGKEMTVIGCIGDTANIDSKLFEIDSAVDKVMHVQEPYKPCIPSGRFHHQCIRRKNRWRQSCNDRRSLFRRIIRTGS